ncbi:MAG: glutathione S-transferase [Geminicoccaceae bacterium]
MQLYDHPLSGHAHRVRLFLSLLGLPYERIEVDLAAGAHKTPEFLARNRFGQVPVLVDGNAAIADSNAILVYLARRHGRSDWLPEDPLGAAAVQRWLSVAAGQLAYGPAAARLVTLFGATFRPDEVIARAHALLQVLEAELTAAPWLAAGRPTIADVALYGYVARAPEGNVDLAAYPQVRAWLARIEALPGFVPFKASPVGLAAAA